VQGPKEADDVFATRLAAWTFDHDHAFVREGDNKLSLGKTMLYMQGW
jgi:hypothetical protein